LPDPLPEALSLAKGKGGKGQEVGRSVSQKTCLNALHDKSSVEGCEGWGQKNPVFLLKTGFFIRETMKIQAWYKIRKWNLRMFFSISLGIHLLFLVTAYLLLPDMKIDRHPVLHVEVSLIPLMAEEKPIKPRVKVEEKQVKAPIKKEEKKELLSLPVKNEVKHNPIPDPPPLPIEYEKKEVREKDKEKEKEIKREERLEEVEKLEDAENGTKFEEIEKLEKEPVVQAKTISSNPEPVLTFQKEEPPEYQNHPLLSVFPTEESRSVARETSSSQKEMIFTQPSYAENPKPFYPREARKWGYEGEVVLKVEVLSNGQVGQVEVKRSSGHEILDRSALDAVKQWKFIPAKKGENPIPFWVNIPVKFQLQ
jgi:TonB family protein